MLVVARGSINFSYFDTVLWKHFYEYGRFRMKFTLNTQPFYVFNKIHLPLTYVNLRSENFVAVIIIGNNSKYYSDFVNFFSCFGQCPHLMFDMVKFILKIIKQLIYMRKCKMICIITILHIISICD